MNKKILLSLMAIGLVVSVVGGMTWAQWTADTEVLGSTISTGNADLKVKASHFTNWYDVIDENVAGGNLLGSEDIYPGWSITHDLEVKNDSSADIAMALSVYLNIPGATSDSNLRNTLNMRIYDGEGIDVEKTMEDWRGDGNAEYFGVLSKDEEKDLKVEFSFPSSPGQDNLQDVEIENFDLVIEGVQVIGEVLNVNTGDSYSTIQDAVDNANEDNTLLVSAGTYEEMIEVDVKGLTIKGLTNPVVRNPESGFTGGTPVIQVNSEDVKVEGLTVHIVEAGGNVPTGIVLSSTAHRGHLLNNTIKIDFDSGHVGIGSWGAEDTVIENNNLDIAIGADATGSLVIKGNTVARGYDEGIWINGVAAGTDITIENNTIEEYSVGNPGNKAVKIISEPNSVNGETNTSNKLHISNTIKADNIGVDTVELGW